MTAVATRDLDFDQDLAKWTPRQQEACDVADEHQFTLFGGYRGPGKSYWLRFYGLKELLRLAGDGIRGARGALFCESYPVLTDRQIGPISREFPAILGKVRSSPEHGLGFHLAPRWGGGVLALRNLDDLEKYKSAEFAFELVDQLEQNPVEMFSMLRGSLRWPGVSRPRFCATANPGGIGHLWVRDLWVDRLFPEELKPLAEEFAFVEAKPYDNPHLAPDYWQMLETLPEPLRQAWLLGNWNLFEGQMFSEWRARTQAGRPWHVIPMSEFPEGQAAYLGVDWGFSDPCAIYLLAVALDGRITVCRESYVTQKRTSDLGEIMVKMLESAGLSKVTLVYAGHDAFSRRLNSRGEYDEPIVKTWQDMGLRCVSAGRDPLFRASKYREYLRDWGPDEGWPEGRPGLQVMECCRNLIRTLPALPADKTNVEVVDTKAEDHAYDAVGHVLTSLPHAPRPRRPMIVKTFAEEQAEKISLKIKQMQAGRKGGGWVHPTNLS